MQHGPQDPSQPKASSVSQPGLALPTPSMQNQIHELAKTLPPPRKQNTACDACRARKVKCNRLPGQEKCQHCLSKNYPCTHFIQQATSEKRRGSAASRRPRNLTNVGTEIGLDRRIRTTSSMSPQPPKQSSPSSDYNAPSVPSPPPYSGSYQPNQLSHQQFLHQPISINTTTPQILAQLFSPPDNPSDGLFKMRSSPYSDWGDVAVKLQDESFRAEFALDLVEVFFQIVHLRIPILNPTQFRSHLNLQGLPQQSSQKPLHPALVATVLAWGAKFSEHPLLVADRRRPSGQSNLAKTLVDRARQLAESMKVHRVPTADHVVIALLIEPLQPQNPDDPNGFHGFWLSCAIRNLLDLGINHKSVMANIQDPDARGTMIFAWWMACLCDAYHAVYYRRKPMLDDDDYDIDFYTADPIMQETIETQSPKPSPREQLEFLGYYRASHALARIARQIARQLWRPATDSDGMNADVVNTFTAALVDWREQHLSKVGVPSNFQADWDFVSAVSACASDATYHVMWIILFNALDDFGIREINEAVRGGSPPDILPNHQFEAAKRKVADEAVHSALRIAGLAGVLTTNGYLRLDSAVMHVSCIQAGTLLARLGRPEVSNCIAALEQYGAAYEEVGEQAVEIRRIYASARSGEFDFNHMASVSPRSNVGAIDDNNHSMNIDSLSVANGSNNYGHSGPPASFSESHYGR